MAAEYLVMMVILYRTKYGEEYMNIHNSVPIFRKRKRWFLGGYEDEGMEKEKAEG